MSKDNREEIQSKIEYLENHTSPGTKIAEHLGEIREYIDNLENETGEVTIDSGADANGWISVEDRLPGNGNECLVYFKDVNGMDFIFISQYFKNARPKPSWTYENSNEGEITHWQPLPKPPITIKGE